MGMDESKGCNSPQFRFENAKPAPTDAELINDLRRVAALMGASHVPQNAYRQLGAYSSTVMKTRFGSWNKALEAAARRMSGLRKRQPNNRLALTQTPARTSEDLASNNGEGKI